MVKINYAGIIDYSSVDVIGKISAVVYLCGCPFRCPYCQNPDLVLRTDEKYGICKKIEISEIVEELKKNFIIDSVCITGGEPLIQKETIDLLKKIKEETKLFLKLDTNGNYPERLKDALNFCDFVSIDIKGNLYNEKFGDIIGIKNFKEAVKKIEKSLEILMEWDKKKEARTTVVPTLIDEKEVDEISKIVNKYKFDYYTLMEFRAERTLNPEFEKISPYSYDQMINFGKIAKRNLKNTIVRVTTSLKGTEIIT